MTLTDIGAVFDRWWSRLRLLTRPGRTEIAPVDSDATNSRSSISESVQGAAFPYDENLLERSRTQWQFGDWESLAKIERDTLQHHPDRAKLALLAAAGHQSLGDAAEARKHTRLAIDWGCSKKLVTQILISGVHNTLGRAAGIVGQHQRLLRHFESAITVGTPGADQRLLTQARVNEQYRQLALSNLQLRAPIDGIAPAPDLQKQRTLTVNIIATHQLGDAWSGNTINTVIFRHHGILTSGQNQFTAFYVDAQTMRVVQRDLILDTLQTHDIHGEYNLKDAHNSISLGIDRAGHLHISYDHHATQLRYRRSIWPVGPLNALNEWTAEKPMTGQHEARVTYPTFILPRKGFPLTLLYRDGNSAKGTARLKTFDEKAQTWSDHPVPILSGTEQKPWTSNAYWNHPAIGKDGSLHLSFVWRTHSLGEEKRVNNLNIGYAHSNDNGLTWYTSKDIQYKLPITQVNAEVIYPVSPGSNLINQTSMALDSQNRPHIVFYSNDPEGIPQYQHLWFNGKIWRHQFISKRVTAFSLQGGGTLQIPISRPEILIDSDDNVYVITRGDTTQDRMAVTFLNSPEYSYEEYADCVLYDQNLGFAEPIIDRSRWATEETLTMLLQHNQQPDNDLGHQSTQSPIALIDYQLNPRLQNPADPRTVVI